MTPKSSPVVLHLCHSSSQNSTNLLNGLQSTDCSHIIFTSAMRITLLKETKFPPLLQSLSVAYCWQDKMSSPYHGIKVFLFCLFCFFVCIFQLHFFLTLFYSSLNKSGGCVSSSSKQPLFSLVSKHLFLLLFVPGVLPFFLWEGPLHLLKPNSNFTTSENLAGVREKAFPLTDPSQADSQTLF